MKTLSSDLQIFGFFDMFLVKRKQYKLTLNQCKQFHTKIYYKIKLIIRLIFPTISPNICVSVNSAYWACFLINMFCSSKKKKRMHTNPDNKAHKPLANNGNNKCIVSCKLRQCYTSAQHIKAQPENWAYILQVL